MGWHPCDWIEFRILPMSKGRQFWLQANQIPSYLDKLEYLNNNGANIFVGVLPRKHKGGSQKKDILAGKTVWADFDHVGIETVSNRISKSNLPLPTMIISSGHGYHTYWQFERAIPAFLLKSLARDISHSLQADPKVCNEQALLRLPGFINWKSEPVECKIIEANPTKTFSFQNLRKIIPVSYLQPHNKPKHKSSSKAILTLMEHQNRSFQHSFVTVAKLRMADMEKLLELRDGNIVEGMRQKFLWQYRKYQFIATGKDNLQNILAINKTFKKPLKKREVIQTTRDTTPDQMPKSEILIEWFQITTEETMQMKTIIPYRERVIRQTKARKEERLQKKLERQENGKMLPREKKTTKRLNIISKLHSKGLSTKEISQTLNVSNKTVYKYLKLLKA
jgi:hypothetical protein